VAYAITQSCCKDTSCVSVCPVDCIHPTPDEPDFATAEILYIDPKSCIDCGACADACPVSAAKPVELLRGADQVFEQLNAAYFQNRPERQNPRGFTWDEMGGDLVRPLSVAIVGTGPAASYAARQLLLGTDAKVTMIDKLPVPGGLVRGGVAPDHLETKQFQGIFHWAYKHPRTKMVMNVDVGTDVTHDELLRFHDIVLYGVGARKDRELGVSGEQTPGVLGAPDVVAWYNGSFQVAGNAVQIVGDRVVIVGNGNVALDLARIFLQDPEALAQTDMSDHAVAELRKRRVREVVLLGRRGPASAAFTRPELLTMPAGIEVVVARDTDTDTEAELAGAEPESSAELLASLPLVDLDLTKDPVGERRLVFAFGRTVSAIHGTDRVSAVEIASSATEAPIVVPCGTLIRATGHLGEAIAGLPFSPESATVPNNAGRVFDPQTDEPVPGTYVVGWIKRGAHGGIGANRVCAHETVGTIVADANAGVLRTAPQPASAFDAFVRERVDQVVGRRRMLAIEKAETKRGVAQGRPRVKFETVEEMLKVRSTTSVY